MADMPEAFGERSAYESNKRVAGDTIRLLIAEDERPTRLALTRLLSLEPDFEIVGSASDGEEAVQNARERKPDVVLTDIAMPRLTGIQVTQILKEEMPDTKIVILTIYRDDANVFAALKAGATGYVLKDAPPAETVAAVRAAAKGEAILDPAIATRVITEFNRLWKSEPEPDERFAALSDRELEVLRALASGGRNKEIGEKLFIAEKTVKNHVSAILWKLHVNTRAEAALLAARRGLT